MFTPAPVSKTGRKLRITRRHGLTWLRSRSAEGHDVRVLSTYAFAFRWATPSRAPSLDVFRVVHGVGRMLDLVFFDVTVGKGMNADSRLATLARAIRLGTLCGEVPRLVTVVTDVSPIGLRDGGPRGRRGTNRCERSFRRRPLVLCRVNDFDRRWAGHLELQTQLVSTVPVHLRGGDHLGQGSVGELVVQDPDVRLHKFRKTSDEDVLNVLDVEQTVQEVALRFHAMTKGRGRLIVLLLHRNDVLIGVSHSCVRRILRKKPVDGISVCTDGITLTSKGAVKSAGEGHLGVAGWSKDHKRKGLTVRQPRRVARAAKGRQEREDAQGQGSREWLLTMERSVQTFEETLRPLRLFRRIRQLTSDQEVLPVVQECLEAAISRADHLDPIGFFKSLLPFGGGRGALARGRVRLA